MKTISLQLNLFFNFYSYTLLVFSSNRNAAVVESNLNLIRKPQAEIVYPRLPILVDFI